MKKYFALVVLFLLPWISQACSVCKGGYTQQQINAYLHTTILLASMPILLAGFLFLWIYRRYKATS